MRLSRLHIDQPLAAGEFDLPEAQSHYLGRVLRQSAGDAVQLFDGSGLEFRGEILDVGKKRVRVRLDQGTPGQPESSLQVHLGQGLSRGERMDWAIQKATELGATRITPLFTERCEVKLSDERADKRLAHWRQVIISACEQCGRSVLPHLDAPQRLQDWLPMLSADLKLLLHPEAPAMGEHRRPGSLALLVGPEGGLTDTEIELSGAQGFTASRLGPRVLRTETAPVAALSVAQYLWGDMGS